MLEKMKILVVDDEPFNIHIVSSALGEEFEVFSAQSGHDAIALVKETPPDLILLDVMMPGLSGFEVCRIIKAEAEFADIPVIFLTAMDSSGAEATGLDAGGIDYIAKPVNLALLQLRVRNHLELKRKNDMVLRQRDLLARQTRELETALLRVKRLEGIIPICMYCKNIRDDKNIWQELEAYLLDHTDARLSHGLCPACRDEHYPELTEG